MTKQAGRLALAIAAAAALAGCESARFGGAPEVAARPVARSAPAAPPPVEAIPSGSVTSEPLAPIPGTGPVASIPDVPSLPPVSGGNPAEVAPAPTVIASASPSRSGAIGTYTARDATGSTCRVTLSSASTLDLYRASANGCQNKDLGRITAWDFRDGEVYLYQPGGSVAARLRSEGGTLNGVIAKSGAPLTLTR